MSFQDVAGQQPAVSFLQASFLKGRLGGAYVFVGPEGVGKSRLAREFAKLLVCEAATGPEPCDSCPSCARVSTGQHPDVLIVSPENGVIKIDTVRQVCRRLGYKSFEARRKVLIIEDAHCLNEESSNALLKNLEEPAPGTVVLLTVLSLRLILPTIVSRCQRVVFSGIHESDIAQILGDHHGADPITAKCLARMARGSLGRAIGLQKRGFFESKNKFLGYFFDRELQGREFYRFLSKSAGAESSDQDFIDMLLAWYRDLLLVKSDEQTAKSCLMNIDQERRLFEEAPPMSTEEIIEKLMLIAQAQRDFSRQLNPKIVWEKLRTDLWK